MRVVFTRRDIALDRPDGINRSIFAYASELCELGHDVWVVGPSTGSLQTLHSQHSYRSWPEVLPLSRAGQVTYRDALMSWVGRGRAVLKALNPDIVVMNGLLPFRLPGRNIVAVVHDWESAGRGSYYVRSAVKKRGFRSVDQIAATCSELVDVLRSVGHLSILAPNAIPFNSDKVAGLTERARRIVHIGTHAYKNPHATLDLWNRCGPDADLVFVGESTPSLIEAIDRAKQRERISVTGFISDSELSALLRNSRVVAVPSQYAVPVHSPTVLDAFSHGTPVIGSSISSDLLQDGVNGYRYDGALAATTALSQLLDDDRVWQLLSDGAFGKASQFDRKHVVPKFLRDLEREA